ncbi:MAG: YiiX/YebB-like N1pC/P60 family cysteine hydrolase [Hyphomicrobiaceae bacterium]
MHKGGLEQLQGVLDGARALSAREHTDSATLVASLRQIYQTMFNVDFADYDVAAVRDAAPQLRREMMAVQLDLRGRVPAWAAAGLMTRPAQAALRDVFRVIRYARDLVAEIALGHQRLDAQATVAVAFADAGFFLEPNPSFGNGTVALRPGDVVLQRGRVHNSAAIARIGDIDSQFSHVSLVGEAGDGSPIMVEALIEDGCIVSPIQKSLAHSVARAVVFRHKDADLAARAAELIRDHVLAADGEQRPRILYDFSMELVGYQELFCAKLVRLAYSMASTGDVQIPRYPTVLDMRNRDFVGRIGVTATETFAPGDMELESDFDIVAEWHDYRVTSELRLKDMIMTKLFEWMDKHGYRFEPTPAIEAVALLGRVSAHLPDAVQEITRGLLAKVPPNMSASAIAAVAMLHRTAEELYAKLAEAELDTIARTGRQMHPREVLGKLERYRAELGPRIGYLVQMG